MAAEINAIQTELLEACEWLLRYCGLPLDPGQECMICAGPLGDHISDCPVAKIEAAVSTAKGEK